MDYLKSIAKAVAAGLAAAIGSMLLVLQGNDTLASVNTAEWLTVALNVLGAYGVVWAVPNQQL